MIGRRDFITSSVAFGAASAAWARPLPGAKSRAIEALELPTGFNGLLAYGHGGKLQHLRCAGFADVEARKPVTALTQFKWGSASKWLTSVAVLRLAERNRLSLDAPITSYLPDFRRETGEHVRVRHLLSNTSGIPDLLGRQIRIEPDLRGSTATARAIVARFGGGDAVFEPGKGWDYAALNWVIVAALVEQITGERLADVVRQLVLPPLGMSGAAFAQSDQSPLPRLAAASGSVAPPVRKMLPVPPFLAASGNIAGTADDAMRAAHGIFHGSLLRPASRKELTTVCWPEQDYALGGRIHLIDGDPWAWETGKVEGYRAHIAHRLARSETVVVFNTTDLPQSLIGGWVEAIARS